MKLWTKSSIQTCQARLFRGTGAFFFGSVGLGEGFTSGVGVGEISTGLGVGEGITAVAVGNGAAVCCGVGVGPGTTSVFFCARNAQNVSNAAAARTIAPMTNAFLFGPDFSSASGVRCFIATSIGAGWVATGSASGACSSNSLIARATGGICFDTGCESA